MAEPAYDAEEIAEVFGRAAPTYDTVIPFFTRFGARLVEVGALEAGERVLDVGCGQGATLFPAAARVAPGGEVVGIDLSEEMVTRLGAEVGARGVANASVQRMDVEDLDVGDHPFDVVIASFLLHLVPEPAQAAASLRQALRPEGRCVASVPAWAGAEWDFVNPLFTSFSSRAVRPMAVPFRPDFDLAAVLTGAGFDVVHAADEEQEFSFADEQSWWAWAWSTGYRAALETFRPEDLEDLRRAMFTELAARRGPDGLLMRQRARFVVATRLG